TIIFGLNHALFTAVPGAALGYSRYALSRPKRLAAPFLGLGAAILLHATHNFFVATGTVACLISLVADWLGVIVLVLVGILAARTESRLILDELREEVETGLMTLGDARAAASYTHRRRDRRILATHAGPKAAERLAE